MFIDRSLKLGTVSRIPVYLHWSFGLLAAFFLFAAGFGGLALFGLLMLSVLFHEFGHALVAQRVFAAECDFIILNALGGVAGVEIPRDSKKEILIAGAGPAASLFLALVGHILYSVTGGMLFYAIAYINYMLAVFNMLPAFPLDGGRVLRGLLYRYLSYLQATKTAVLTSKIICVAGFFLALWQGYFMAAVIAVFVFYICGHELEMLEKESR